MKTLRRLGSDCIVLDHFAPGRPEVNFTGTYFDAKGNAIPRVPAVASVSDETAALLLAREPGEFEEVKESKPGKSPS